ncbi:MAG TPA: electron transport complex subunit RsxC, partial [Desulfosarcina sp.]|nr:electron transport complex subunit RsxC [Desulfosarcina sp.]
SVAAVKPKTQVAVGDLVAKGGSFVSAALHAPIAGKVMKTAVTTLANGRHVQGIPIKADGEQVSGQALWDDVFGGDWPKHGFEDKTPREIVDAIRDAGIVGLGGAAFPAHVKYVPNDKKPIDTVLVNGCECEPYLTADYRVMVEAPAPVITGALILGRVTGAKEIVVGVEDNKPEAVEALRKAAAGTSVKIAVLKTKYPQGSEKQLIMAVTGREVPLGGLPLDVGVAVSNVGTAAAIARAVVRGKPLTHRVVSVTGAGIRTPKNLLVPIGIRMGDLIDFCGGLKPEAARIVAGGPMMGFAFHDMDTPVTKGTSGITVLTHKDLERENETNCVRCGRCVDACPMNLVPTKLALASRCKDSELAQRYNIMGCFECGSCAYICPANIPIVQLVRTGKAVVIAASKK